MAILKRLSSLFTFNSPAAETATPPSNDKHGDRYRAHVPLAMHKPPAPVFVKPTTTFKRPVTKITYASTTKPVMHPPASPSADPKMDALLRARKSMSPLSKVNGYLNRTVPSAVAVGGKRKYAFEKESNYVSASKKSKYWPQEAQDEDDLDGSTFIDTTPDNDGAKYDMDREWQGFDDVDETLIEPTPAKKGKGRASTGPNDAATVITSASFSVDDAPQAASIFISNDRLRSLGWPEDTLPLVQKLHQRGREPILPAHWAMDFPFLPEALFSPDSSRTFITSLGGKSDFHATKALNALFQMSGRGRDKAKSKRAPESFLKNEVRKYIEWGYADARLSKSMAFTTSSRCSGKASTYAGSVYAPSVAASTIAPSTVGTAAGNMTKLPPLVLTYVPASRISANQVEKHVEDGLIALHQQWSDFLPSETGDLPTVYAAVVYSSHITVVCWAGRALRTVGNFDTRDAELDVWNGLAVAILGCHVRDTARSMWSKHREVLVSAGVGDVDAVVGGAADDDDDDPDL